jgi:hypothetical protein
MNVYQKSRLIVYGACGGDCVVANDQQAIPRCGKGRGERTMRENEPIFARIGRVLHDRFDKIVHRPLSERWIDLINRLNFEEEVPADLGKAGHQVAE